MSFRSWAYINITNLIQNLENLYSFSKKGIFAVVKADAYGHDVGIVSRAISELEYVKKLCVATPVEGKELREFGIQKDILVLGGILEGEEEIFLRYNLIPVVSTFESLYLARKFGIKKIHIKFDTGMHRLGFYIEEIPKLKPLLSFFEVEGVMSHFPSADTDKNFTSKQINDFYTIIDELKTQPRHIHLQNSAGVVYSCERCTDIRVGLAMYGEKPCEDFPIDLKQVMSVHSKIISIKDIKKGSKVSYCGTYTASKDIKAGVVAFGYADGLPRLLSNRGHILVNGKKMRIIGNITMDMTVVDLSDTDAKVGDEVVIAGQQGDNKITFTDIANLSRTIPYEIMCGISKRVKRIEVR